MSSKEGGEGTGIIQASCLFASCWWINSVNSKYKGKVIDVMEKVLKIYIKNYFTAQLFWIFCVFFEDNPLKVVTNLFF